MPIPASGPISMSMFNTELGRAFNTADSLLAGGSTPTVGSLFWLAAQSGTLNQTAPHSMNEWYGYTAGSATTTTTTTSTTTTTTTSATSIVRTYFESAYVSTRSETDLVTPTFISASSMTISGSANTRSAVFWMGISDLDSVTFDAIMRLSGSSGVSQSNNMEPQDTTDRMSVGGMYAYSSSANIRWAIQAANEDPSTIMGYSGYAMVGLRLTGSEAFGSSSAASNTTSTTYATKTSVTVGAGTYIIVGSAAIGTNSTAGNPRFRIFDGTNTFGEILDAYAQDTNTRSPYWHVFRRTVAGSTTFNLQYRGDGTNQGIIQGASILALDTSRFQNVYYAENTGSVSTTSTTYVNAFSASFNITNPTNKHILLASAMLSGSSTVNSFACKLTNNTSVVDYSAEHLREPNATSEELPTVVARTITFGAGNNVNEIAWQFDTELGGTTAHLKNMVIVLLDTGTT